jgi:hypothetical protein
MTQVRKSARLRTRKGRARSAHGFSPSSKAQINPRHDSRIPDKDCSVSEPPTAKRAIRSADDAVSLMVREREKERGRTLFAYEG